MDTYEKKYKEALERARQIKDGKDEWRYSDLAEITPALTEIFPELRESEDERIRKWVIEELEITRDAMSGKNPYSDDPDIVARLKRLDEAIDYLEKQKEQKPAEWSEEDEAVWMDIKSHMIHGSFIPFDKIEWIENRLKSLRPSWKPSEEQMEALESEIKYCYACGLHEGGRKLQSLYEQLKKL